MKSCEIEGCTQRMEVLNSLRKKSQLFENLNDAYSVYVTVKGKTDINRKPFERQIHTDDERLSNG